MSVALIDSTKFPARLVGNGVTTVYPFQYKVLAKGDIRVYVAGVLQVVDVNYTVTGFNDDAGGTVTFLTGAPANGASVIIMRSMQQRRTTDYQQLGDFKTVTVNPDFDNAVLLIQDLAEAVSRSLQSSVLDPLTSVAIDKTSFAGQFISVNGSGAIVPSSGTGNDSALRTDLANTTTAGKGNDLISYRRTAAEIAALVTPVSYQYWSADILAGHLFRFMSAAEITDIISGASALNHTAAWTNWSNAVQASKNRYGFAPGGTYNIDSWTVSAIGSRFEGGSISLITLTMGVKVRCRSAQTNFIAFNGATHAQLSNMEIDGNNFTTNTVRIANQLTDLKWDNITVGGCVDGGVNLNMAGTTTNTAISELTFTDVNLAGCGNRGSGTGITNLLINSDQSLVIKFDRLRHFGNTAGATDVPISVDIKRGTVTFITPFSTKVMTNDYRLGFGAGSGSVTIVDGRSESDTADSINAVIGAGDLTLVNYVHATATNTSLTIASGYTGRVTALGGQFNNITNSSSTANVVLNNIKVYATGVIGGTYANRIVTIIDRMITANRRSTLITTLTYGTTVTIDASTSDRQYLLVLDGVAFTMAAPTNATAGQTLFIDIQNGNGGAMGAITWNAVFKLAGAFVNPASAKRRKIFFTFDGATWSEDGRTAADGAV